MGHFSAIGFSVRQSRRLCFWLWIWTVDCTLLAGSTEQPLIYNLYYSKQRSVKPIRWTLAALSNEACHPIAGLAAELHLVYMRICLLVDRSPALVHDVIGLHI